MSNPPDNPFKLTLYDQDFNRTGWLGDPLRLEAVIRHNDVGTLDIYMSDTNTKIPKFGPGARVVCEYNGDHLLSGMVRRRTSSSAGEYKVTVIDDFRLFKRVQGWPSPASAISSSTPTTQPAEYHTVSGPAENVAKAFVRSDAVTRLGLPVTVEADGGLGDSITASLRFHPLYDRLFPAVTLAGVGIGVKQQGSGLYVYAYEPQVYPRPLTVDSGVILEWSWSSSAPEGTRGVVGGGGEGTARTFVKFSDTTRESDWGDVVEVFRDARDTSSGSVYAERAAETLGETAEKSGLSVRFSETPNFTYGAEFVRGDIVPLQLPSGLTITDTLREVKLSWTNKDGLKIQPSVGDISDNPDAALAKAIRRTASDVRNLRSR